MDVRIKEEVATLAGGCFWCLEAPFRRLRGVREVISGYMGGHVENPDYKQVCTGTTGHAEVIQVHFDPSQISYRELLEVFFALHDPTTLNRQGNDIGTQYRSAIFYHTSAQFDTAQEVVAALNASNTWPDAVATEITPAPVFYPAEPYHQHFFDKNPYQPYCQAVIGPKLEKLRISFQPRMKEEAL